MTTVPPAKPPAMQNASSTKVASTAPAPRPATATAPTQPRMNPLIESFFRLAK